MPITTNYENILTLARTTLPKVFGRPGEKFSLINEVIDQDHVAGKYFRRMHLDEGEGTTLKFPLQFKSADTWRPVGPYTKLQPTSTPAPDFGEVARRFLAYSWYKPYVEIHLNKGLKEVLLDLMRVARESVAVDFSNKFNRWFWDRKGNYQDDGQGAGHLLFQGLRYWATIDGLYITGDTSKTIAGINPFTQPLWRNQYFTPAGRSDGDDELFTSIYLFREMFDAAFQALAWHKYDWYGQISKDIKDAPVYDPTRKAGPKDLHGTLGRKSHRKLRRVIFDREDNVGRDQSRPHVVYQGIEFDYDTRVDMNEHGYGKSDDNLDLWTDRGGTYASGQWGGYGECFLTNTSMFHCVGHPEHAPYNKKPFEPEGMFGIAMEGDMYVNTMCRSRQRGLCYMLFPLDN